jgi:N-sulfoglucosamine sulfohydrolase
MKQDRRAQALLDEHHMKTFIDRVDYLKSGGDLMVPNLVSEFLDGNTENKPFFLWANFSDPHHTWDAPGSYRPKPESLKLPAHWPDLPGMREQVADYCAEVNRLDESIGKVIQILEERDLIRNTIIVFAGDNGAALPHGKGSLYDPGSNVPLIVSWPGLRNRGIDSRDLISGEDIAPTLLEAAGVNKPKRMSGQSFWGHLMQLESYVPRNHVFVERGPHGSASVSVGMANSGYDLGRAVRSDRYKFIYNCTPWIPYAPVDSANGAAWSDMKRANEAGTLGAGLVSTYFTAPRPVYELYDLESDPSELNNLAGKADFAEAEDRLRLAMVEKMLLDFDYLPLPDSLSESSRRKETQRDQSLDEYAMDPKRLKQFARLDLDGDGKLNFKEFVAKRELEEATIKFKQRDANNDQFVDREEYGPLKPRPKKP